MTDETTCRQCTGALPAAGMSRRALLNRFGMGLGGMALANLVNPARLFAASSAAAGQDRGSPRRPASPPGEGQAGDLSVHGRRAVADRDVRLQARAHAAQRRAAARFRSARAAAHRDVRQPVVAAAGGLAVRVRPVRQQRHMGVGSAAAHGQDHRPVVRRPIDVHRRDQPRPGDHLLPDRLADRRPAQHGRVGSLRARQRQRESPGVRRPHHAGPGGSAAVFAALGQRVPSVRAPGRAVPERQGRGVVPGEPGWRDAREPAAAAGSFAGPARARGRAARRHRGGLADRAVPDVVPDAGERARRDGHLERDAGDARALRKGCRHARDVCRQLPARAPPGRAGREVHPALSPGLGPARHPPAEHPAGSARRPTRRARRSSRI